MHSLSIQEEQIALFMHRSQCQLLTSQQQRGSHGDDRPLRGGEGGESVEVVHRILEEERHLHIYQLQRQGMRLTQPTHSQRAWFTLY